MRKHYHHAFVPAYDNNIIAFFFFNFFFFKKKKLNPSATLRHPVPVLTPCRASSGRGAGTGDLIRMGSHMAGADWIGVAGTTLQNTSMVYDMVVVLIIIPMDASLGM